MNKRIRLVRKTLGYNQKEFAKVLGIAQTSVSFLEKDGSTVTEQNIKAICRECNVDYMWLTTGHGEMFSSTDNDYLELIDNILQGENETAKSIFKSFARYSEEDWAALEKVIDTISSIKIKDKQKH